MSERLVREIVGILLLLMLMPLALTVFGPMLGLALGAILGLFSGFVGLVGSVLGVLLVVSVVVGLFARLRRWVRASDPQLRRREAEERRARLAVRHRAEDVAVVPDTTPDPEDDVPIDAMEVGE